MNITRLLKPAALFVMLPFLPGCLGLLPFFGLVEVTKPDPLRKKAVKIVKVTGTTVTLVDGREIELAGLKPVSGGKDQYHAEEVHDMARSMIGSHVVVVPEGQGRGRIILIHMHEKPIHRYCGEPPVFYFRSKNVTEARSSSFFGVQPLFPIFVEKKPHRYRCDLGASMLEQGQAELSPEEITDPKIRAEYVAKAESARKEKVGIWKSVDERLRDAVIRKDIKTVRLLLGKGADPNWIKGRYGYNFNSLLLASQRKDGLEMVRVMLKNGGDPNIVNGRFKKTPLYAAAEAGNMQTAVLLLKHGAEIDVVLGSLGTPLMAAAREHQQEMVIFLLDKGADLKVGGGTETALYYFCSPGELEMVKLLISHGANPNAVHHRRTPLQMAAESGAMEIAAFLISQGVDINAKEHRAGGGYHMDRNTPLHWAVRYDKKEMVELLISKGADVNISGNGKQRPLKMARRFKRREIANILRAHGARE